MAARSAFAPAASPSRIECRAVVHSHWTAADGYFGTPDRQRAAASARRPSAEAIEAAVAWLRDEGVGVDLLGDVLEG